MKPFLLDGCNIMYVSSECSMAVNRIVCPVYKCLNYVKLFTWNGLVEESRFGRSVFVSFCLITRFV